MVRFRILNGSDARVYQLHLSDSTDFWQIASDGGLLEKPITMSQVQLGAAERAEILIDFSRYKQGDSVNLPDQDAGIMEFRTGNSDKAYKLPAILTSIPRMKPSRTVRELRY